MLVVRGLVTVAVMGSTCIDDQSCSPTIKLRCTKGLAYRRHAQETRGFQVLATATVDGTGGHGRLRVDGGRVVVVQAVWDVQGRGAAWLSLDLGAGTSRAKTCQLKPYL